MHTGDHLFGVEGRFVAAGQRHLDVWPVGGRRVEAEQPVEELNARCRSPVTISNTADVG